MTTWLLRCSSCGEEESGSARVGTCRRCGQPFLAEITTRPARDALRARWDMWRYAAALPLADDETPVTLGEGFTPLLELPHLARELGVRRFWVKDEGVNPTASFKARGLSAAVTRARALGVTGLVVPTAGNAGAALAAYGAAARLPVRVYAPATTPRPILETITAVGADLCLVDGHIGDAGKAAAAFAAESGFMNVATLREPYRAEGNKTLGYELAEQMEWRLPDAIVYPTGGGEGVIGMWKAFSEMVRWAWLHGDTRLPRMIVAQADGCAPLVRAFREGAEHATAWDDPSTHAAGLRVPAPLGDRLVLRAVRESGGDVESASEDAIRRETRNLAVASGVDAAPEGGCALAVARSLVESGRLDGASEVVLYNTGSGASYR